jgi:hypothetical protein
MKTQNEMVFQLGDKSIKLSADDLLKGGVPTEGVNANLAMTVDSSANYATNAQEYFTRAMIGDEATRTKFRQLLGVKDRVKLGGVTTTSVNIKPYAAAFAPDDTTILQKEYVVKPLMWGTKFDVRSLEISFVSDQLAKGSNNFSDSFAFMSFFYSEVQKRIQEELEQITFSGTVATDGVDGLEVLFAADTNVLKPTAGNGGIASAVTTSNVIAKLTQARNVVPKAIRKRNDFVYIVAQNVYDALADVVSENKASGLYYLEGETMRFQGREVYLADGASNNTIVCTYWENLVNVMDLMSDEVGFNTVDFMGTTLERSIGIRADFKFQPSYVNANEIYFHAFA